MRVGSRGLVTLATVGGGGRSAGAAPLERRSHFGSRVAQDLTPAGMDLVAAQSPAQRPKVGVGLTHGPRAIGISHVVPLGAF